MLHAWTGASWHAVIDSATRLQMKLARLSAILKKVEVSSLSRFASRFSCHDHRFYAFSFLQTLIYRLADRQPLERLPKNHPCACRSDIDSI